MAKNRDSLFDWLVRRAEADLGVAQALAAGENQRAEQIKQLETVLIGQIARLQSQIIESREVELNDLKSEIFACADRIARFESTQSTADTAKQVVQELGDLRAQLVARQTELESSYSGLQRLTESLGTQIRAVEEDLGDKLDGIRTAQTETRHFQSEMQSLAERVAHAESATWQARTLALRNSEQLEQMSESLRAEIVSLNALFAEFNDKQSNLRLPDKLHELAAKIDQIQDRLGHTQSRQGERDLRLGQLDSGLSTLAERITGLEELSYRAHAMIQSEVSSASDFRNRTAQELSALDTRLNDAAIPQRIQELELALRAKVQEYQHQAAQKFVLLEARDAEREKAARELSEILGERLAAQVARTDEKLLAFANDHEELCRLKPKLQTLAQRIVETESATHRAQTRADACAKGAAQLEDRLSKEIAGLNAEVTKLADQQRGFSLPHNELSQIERKLGVAVDEIQRQLSIEREGLDHWGNGLRESFGAELSGVQARLSERQSQIEHRYAGLERWQETVKTSLDGLEIQLKANLQSQTGRHQEWSRVNSDLSAVAERMSRLETRAGEAEERAAAVIRDTEQRVGDLQREISALETSLDQRDISSSDSITRVLEDKLGAKLGKFEEQLANQLSQHNRDISKRTEHSEQIVSRAQNELAILKTAIDQWKSAAPSDVSFSPTLEKALSTKVGELEEKLAAQFSQIENRGAERAQDFKTMLDTLEGELAAIRIGINQGKETPYESSVRGLRESVDKQMQDFQRQLDEKLVLLEKRDIERNQQAEKAVAGLKTETAALSAELIQGRGAISPADPVVLGLQENLRAKIEELRREMGERFSAFNSREADVKELKESSQSLIHRVTQLSAAIQTSHNTPVPALQDPGRRPEVSAAPARPENVRSEENLAEIKARSEKEQLIKLQERMSSEIERVRAELKERSGRWKVRKTAS